MASPKKLGSSLVYNGQSYTKFELFERAAEIFSIPKDNRTTDDIGLLSAAISQIQYFQNIHSTRGENEEFYERCASALEFESFPKHDAIFHFGQVGRKFYIILKGTVHVYIPKSVQELEEEFDLINKEIATRNMMDAQTVSGALMKARKSVTNSTDLSKKSADLSRKSGEFVLKSGDADKKGSTLIDIKKLVGEDQENFEVNDLTPRVDFKMSSSTRKKLVRANTHLNNVNAWAKLVTGGESNTDSDIFMRFSNSDMYIQESICKFKKIRTLHPGDSFGELALTTNKQRTATVIAGEDVQVASLSKYNYRTIFEKKIEKMKAKLHFFKSFFTHCTSESISRFSYRFEEKRFKYLEKIFCQGDVPSELYILIKGEVQLTYQEEKKPDKEAKSLQKYIRGGKKKAKYSPTNKLGIGVLAQQTKLVNVGPGCFFGEEDILLNRQRVATATAIVSDTLAYAISVEEFKILRTRHPDIISVMHEKTQAKLRYRQDRLSHINQIKDSIRENFEKLSERNSKLSLRQIVDRDETTKFTYKPHFETDIPIQEAMHEDYSPDQNTSRSGHGIYHSFSNNPRPITTDQQSDHSKNVEYFTYSPKNRAVPDNKSFTDCKDLSVHNYAHKSFLLSKSKATVIRGSSKNKTAALATSIDSSLDLDNLEIPRKSISELIDMKLELLKHRKEGQPDAENPGPLFSAIKTGMKNRLSSPKKKSYKLSKLHPKSSKSALLQLTGNIYLTEPETMRPHEIDNALEAHKTLRGPDSVRLPMQKKEIATITLSNFSSAREPNDKDIHPITVFGNAVIPTSKDSPLPNKDQEGIRNLRKKKRTREFVPYNQQKRLITESDSTEPKAPSSSEYSLAFKDKIMERTTTNMKNDSTLRPAFEPYQQDQFIEMELAAPFRKKGVNCSLSLIKMHKPKPVEQEVATIPVSSVREALNTLRIIKNGPQSKMENKLMESKMESKMDSKVELRTESKTSIEPREAKTQRYQVDDLKALTSDRIPTASSRLKGKEGMMITSKHNMFRPSPSKPFLKKLCYGNAGGNLVIKSMNF